MDKMMKRSLALGQIDRRSFITSAMAAGVTLSAASLMAREAMAAAPQRGGKLRVGYTQGATSDSMDPATFNNDFMFAIGYAVFNNLVEIDSDMQAQPELAESFKASPDAKTWTFRLRDGVRFSDGQPLRARDVIASISHHMGEKSKSGIKPLLVDIEEMKADGDNVVIFKLNQGNADFPYILNDYHLGIRPANDDGSIDPATMVGSGGYTVEFFEPGVRAVLKRRDDYWKQGRAHIDTVEILAISDVAARMNALMNDEVDLIDFPDLKTIHLLERHKDIKIYRQDGTRHFSLPMHMDVAPFTDNNVRLALKYAFNREELVDKVLKGYGKVGNDQPISPSLLYHNADLPARDYDPDKSKFYMKKSDVSTIDVSLHTADAAFNGAIDTSVLFAEAAKAAGINIRVVREPNDGYWSNVWLKKPFVTTYWGGRPTAGIMFSTAYASDAQWNESHFSSTRFDELLVQARSELDQDKRGEIYGEMQRLISDEGGTIIPAFDQYVAAMNKRVHTPDAVTPLMALDSIRYIERWWVA